MWKVKDLSEWCNLKSTHDEDIVRVYTLDKYGDEVFVDEDFMITTRKPKKTEFTHRKCGYCEEICFKGVKRLYCNFWNDIILKRDMYSCKHFEPIDEDFEYFE